MKTLYIVPAFIAVEASSVEEADALAEILQDTTTDLYLDELLPTVNTGDLHEPHTVLDYFELDGRSLRPRNLVTE